jgi:hypothetical protein
VAQALAGVFAMFRQNTQAEARAKNPGLLRIQGTDFRQMPLIFSTIWLRFCNFALQNPASLKTKRR